MSIASASIRVTRCQGALGHVCARLDWVRSANFAAAKGIEGTKRQPQPTTYEGKAPDR